MVFNKQKSFLGVDLGAGGVKLVELKEEKGRPVLFTYGLTSGKQAVHSILPARSGSLSDFKVEPTRGIVVDKKKIGPQAIDDREVDVLARNLKEVCRVARTVSKSALVSLPVSAVFHSIVTLPKDTREDLKNILRAEIKKLLPYPIEDMVLDYQVLADFSNDRYKRVMVNATPKILVEFYTRVFTRAGLRLDSLEPESTALERSLVGRDSAVTMLIDMGAERTNFFIIDRATPITHHTIESGGDKINRLLRSVLAMEDDDVAQIRQDLYKNSLTAAGKLLDKDKFLRLLAPIFDPVIKQIEYSFDLYLHQSGNENKRPEKIVLTGGAAMMPYLAEFLGETFNMKCYLGDPWARVVYQDNLKPVLNDIGPRMSVALGLALRYLVK